MYNIYTQEKKKFRNRKKNPKRKRVHNRFRKTQEKNRFISNKLSKANS